MVVSVGAPPTGLKTTSCAAASSPVLSVPGVSNTSGGGPPLCRRLQSLSRHLRTARSPLLTLSYDRLDSRHDCDRDGSACWALVDAAV